MKKVLVIGASTGFGLASKFQVLLDLMRLLLAFFEKPPTAGRTAPGWYNSAAFERSTKAFIC
jgi:trans-2-enoyl-CoA reductase